MSEELREKIAEIVNEHMTNFCKGKGFHKDEFIDKILSLLGKNCPECGGDGEIINPERTDEDECLGYINCPTCKGKVPSGEVMG